MDTDLLLHTRTFLAQHRLFHADIRLLLAVSGGSDSLALLQLCAALRDQGGPQLHVAHLDHGFRGAESAADAAFVAGLADQMGIPATVARQDVPALARQWRLSPQAAARKARYAFLAHLALQVQAHAVATAHQADDQAETVLLHVIRGAGPAGLRGMPPATPWAEWAADAPNDASAPPLLRPFLTVSRAALEAYCRAAGLIPRSDPSNAAPYYTRSRVRHTVLPALQTLNPQAIDALGRTAAICAADYAYMQEQLDAAWPTLVHPGSGWIVFDRAVWADLHVALQRYAFRRAVERLGSAELSFAQIEAARACVAAGTGRQLDLGPELRLETDYRHFMLRLQTVVAPIAAPQLAEPHVALASGRTPLGNGWVCIVQAAPPAAASPWWLGLAVSADAALALRRRQPGDRLRPAGGTGSRTLQDLFVDRKVPRAHRDAWPLLTINGQIAWAAGLRADAQFAVAPDQATIWVGIVRDDT